MFTKTQIKALESLKGWKEFFEQPIQTKNPIAKKQQLLQMARNGEPKPNKENKTLGWALRDYTSKKSGSYDPIFDKQIRELRPDWFTSQTEISDNKKKQLLEMARNGEPRPVYAKHPLGIILHKYTNKNNGSYDPIFDKQIRELRPDWFESRSEIAENKKKQLLEMAKNGEPRPDWKKHPLGKVFPKYTKKESGSYDPIFDKQIRELRPDWFETKSERTNNKKKQLLEMAKNGELRPVSEKHILGVPLMCYTNKKNKCYDPIFDKQIRELRPDWFENTTIGKKQQLLEMARNGEPRPVQGKHVLGAVLCNYTRLKSDCYDPIFNKQILELRPDWFKEKL